MKKVAIVVMTALLVLPVTASALTKQETSQMYFAIHGEKNPGKQLLMMQELLQESGDYERFILLADAAKIAFRAEKDSLASEYAMELLDLAERFKSDWNYGNALHDAHMVLGRVAVRKGDIPAAIDYLEKSGNVPVSPQLRSYGPHMNLASDLLARGEKKAVLNFLEACRKLWSLEGGRIDQWKNAIREGREPDFGANLKY